MSDCKETLSLCSNCIHCPVCANKNTVLDVLKKIDELLISEVMVRDVTWLKLSVSCEHFRQSYPNFH